MSIQGAREILIPAGPVSGLKTSLSHWTNLLNNGLRVTDFENAFTAPQEFQVDCGGQTAAQMLAGLYQSGLGRAPTGAEAGTFGVGTQTSASLLGMVATSQEALQHLRGT